MRKTFQGVFSTTFKKITRLTPLRELDHVIPLKDESYIVNIRPFHYNYFKKNEIENWYEKFVI